MSPTRLHLWSFLRRRSGAGLLLLVRLFLLGPAACPFRPVNARHASAAEIASLLLHTAVPPAPVPSR